MFEAWEKVTGSASPAEWSIQNGIPVLCMFAENILAAQPIFSALNRDSYLPNEKDIDDAIAFLQGGALNILKDKECCEKRFIDFFAGKYAYVITSADELRDQIRSIAGSKVYDWYARANSCRVQIEKFATDRYKAKYCGQAKERIKKLSAEEAQKYLNELTCAWPIERKYK